MFISYYERVLYIDLKTDKPQKILLLQSILKFIYTVFFRYNLAPF